MEWTGIYSGSDMDELNHSTISRVNPNLNSYRDVRNLDNAPAVNDIIIDPTKHIATINQKWYHPESLAVRKGFLYGKPHTGGGCARTT